MEAIFNRNRSTVTPRVAALMVKLGLAKWVDEPEVAVTKKVDATKEVLQKFASELENTFNIKGVNAKVSERKLTVIEQPKVPKQVVKTKVKPKGKPAKAKK